MYATIPVICIALILFCAQRTHFDAAMPHHQRVLVYTLMDHKLFSRQQTET